MAEQKSVANKARNWWWIVIITVFSVVLIYGIILQLRQPFSPSEIAQAKKEVARKELLKPDRIEEMSGSNEPLKIKKNYLLKTKIVLPDSFDYNDIKVEFWNTLVLGLYKKVGEGDIQTLLNIPPETNEVWFFGPEGEKLEFFKLTPKSAQKTANYKPPPR